MPPQFQWLGLILLGGIMGMLGQSARVIVGLKKLNDEAAAKQSALSDMIDPSRLFVSLLIGFVAGALAAIAMQGTGPIDPTHLTKSDIMAYAAAGYTGADFIEGIMSRFLPSGNAAAAQAGDGAANAPLSAGAKAGDFQG